MLLVKVSVKIIQTVCFGLIEHALQILITLIRRIQGGRPWGRRLKAERRVTGIIYHRYLGQIARIFQLELSTRVSWLGRLHFLRLFFLRFLWFLFKKIWVFRSIKGVTGLRVIEVIELKVEIILFFNFFHDISEIVVAGVGWVRLFEEIKWHDSNRLL